MKVNNLYKERFNKEKLKQKDRTWKILCKEFFQKFILENSVVLDIGDGYCEFINNIQAGRKIAVDINEDIKKFANSGVEIINSTVFSIFSLADNSIEIVLMSNF